MEMIISVIIVLISIILVNLILDRVQSSRVKGFMKYCSDKSIDVLELYESPHDHIKGDRINPIYLDRRIQNDNESKSKYILWICKKDLKKMSFKDIDRLEDSIKNGIRELEIFQKVNSILVYQFISKI